MERLGKRSGARLAPVAITAAAFVGALLSRAAWFPAAPFHPDASTVLWMALDATREVRLPDHGLVSSFLVFQPPGLVWLAMPFVALGDGSPEAVIVAFALLNASAVALLVATVARCWGLLYATTLGVFLVVGMDAFASALIWHPSLYTAATALLLAAGIRLHSGSRWWAAVLIALPGLYGLVHYSGLLLCVPAVALLALSRRRWRSLIAPAFCGMLLTLCAWAPFVAFEMDRDWIDLRTLLDAGDDSSGLASKVEERLAALGFALTHLGEAPDGFDRLTIVIWGLGAIAVAAAILRRGWTDPGFAVPAAMLVSGLLTQVAVDQGERRDVLMLWHVPLYAIAAWGLLQLFELVRAITTRPAAAPIVAAGGLVLVVIVGGADLANAIRGTPYEDRLDNKWRVARVGASVDYDDSAVQRRSPNAYYLPCDPPWDWGSEIWYLEEVLEKGRGLGAAIAGGAFRWRDGPACPRHAPDVTLVQ